jgi:hypothetical protein
MNRRLLVTIAVMVLAALCCSCGKGELDITLRTPEGPDEPTQPQWVSVANGGSDITYTVRPTFTWSASQDRSGTGIKGYWVSIDSTEDWMWAEGGTRQHGPQYVVDWTCTIDLSDGSHIIRVKAEDHAGHVGGYASLSFEVELGRPDLVITDLSYTPPNPEVGDEVTVSVSIKNQGDAPGGVRVKIYWDDTHHMSLHGENIDMAAGSEAVVSTVLLVREHHVGQHEIIATASIHEIHISQSLEKSVPVVVTE